MEILTATGGIAGTNCYAIADELTKECVIIDAPDHTVDQLLAEIDQRGWKVNALWLTHGHFDHLADHAVVRARWPQAHVVMHRLDVPKMREPGSKMFRLPFVIPPGEVSAVIEDGDIGEFGSLRGRAIHTPGHSPGHVCFYFEEQKLLIGGDLIIGGAIGRTDLPDASVEDMQASIRKVMALPDNVRLLGGHGGPSTIGRERTNNQWVQLALAGRLAEIA